MNLYVGTSGYSYKEWKGKFYPKGLSAEQMLSYYGARFRSVEINNTFYRMPKAPVLKNWGEQVAADFKFVLKAPRWLTYIRESADAGNRMAQFLKVANALKKRLGPLLFQLPPTAKKDLTRLRAFLALLPSKQRVAFEFRHCTWFDDEVFALLRAQRAGPVHRRCGRRPSSSVRGNDRLGLSAFAAARLSTRGAQDLGNAGSGARLAGRVRFLQARG